MQCFSQETLMDIHNYGSKMATSTPEDTLIEDLITMLGLTQLINKPANYEPNKNPSCIDHVFTNQPV